MTFLLNQFDVMEHLWENVEKTPDGKHIIYMEVDIIHLYLLGFVDTQAIGMDDWIAVFEPFRQPDGTFIVNKDNFLALDKYRYKGEIRVPFNAMLINEGKYTEEGLDDLVQASVAPSCSFSKEELAAFIDTLKKDFRQPDGLILIKMDAKTRIKTILDKKPSPLRNLELLLDEMIAGRGDDIDGEIDRAELDVAAMTAAKQASSFSATPTTKSEAKAAGLKNLTKARKAAATAEVEGKPREELRKIRRSRKGTRG